MDRYDDHHAETHERLYSPEAEQAIIGCCLRAEIIEDRVSGLLPEHFAEQAHAEAFRAILGLWRHGRPADILALDESLPNGAAKSRGLGYWAECAQAGFSYAMLPQHVRIVRDKHARRELLALSNRIAGMVHERRDTASCAAEAAALIAKLADGQSGDTGPQHIADLMAEHLNHMAARWDGSLPGLSTGFLDLDKALGGGGLRGGQLVYLAARPSMGKTSLAMQIANSIAQRDDAAGVAVCFSQEMAAGELCDRLVSLNGRIELSKVIEGVQEDGRGLSSEDHDRIHLAMTRVSQMRLYVDDTPGLRMSELRSRVMRVRRSHPVSVVVVDYLQLMSGEGDQRGANRNSEIEQISRGLKGLAKELDCPVIALSQLSRECEKRPDKRPMMSDLRDSGSIEQDADIVAFIYRDEVYHPDTAFKGIAEILIRKNRQGKTGMVPLVWLGQFTMFADCANYYEIRSDVEAAAAAKPEGRRGKGFAG